MNVKLSASDVRIPLPRSLRTRLLCFLLPAIVLTAGAEAVIAIRAADAQADAIFDHHLEQMATALGQGLPTPGLAPGRQPPVGGPPAEFVVQVWTIDGLQLFRSADTQLTDPRVLGFSSAPADGTVYRVYAMQSRTQVIQVAQDMAPRREMARALALRTVAPIAVLAPLLMALVWWVVHAAMVPVNRARMQVAQRRADELTDLSEVGLPAEIQPLVHELNLLFARVSRAFEAQKSFVADAAHELRSPLAALGLQVQGLRSAVSDSAREIAVARLTAGIERATRLVEQLLMLARQQASAVTGMTSEPVSLVEIVRQEIVDATPEAERRALDLGLIHADDGEIAGQTDALHVLVRNLVDNALKYSPAGGRVDVDIRRDADRIRLCIDDSGPGIAEADRDRVLDRFYRVDGAAAPGSGLGLAIVRAIADLHGARLTLGRSQTLGGLRVELEFATAGRGASTAPRS